MKKRVFALILTLTLCLSLSVPAFAAGGFRDVDKDAWYLEYLDTVVRSGLINGRENGLFAPNDSITGAEAVKLAACLGQLLSEGSVSLTNGSPWYASYMEYAVENGIIDSALDPYTARAPIMRAELMDMVCRAIPPTQRKEINVIPDGAIPDLYTYADYRDNVYTLYRMGILTGSDKRGSCLPERPIRRAEVAALVARVVDEDLRVTFHLDASDPLDFAKEADVRAILEGEWVYCPPVSNTPAAWLTFSENGNFRMRVKDPESGMVWEDAGFCQLDRWNAGENEAPDMLMLTLSQTAANGPANRPMSSAGDYLIVQKTLCDGEIMLSLLQLNNGDSTFSVCFDDWAPVLKKDTGWQPQSERREGDAFYAAVWKVDGRLVWLDDATEDGSNIGRHEALPYLVAPQVDLESLPTWLLADGAIWTVRTNHLGHVVEMQPCIYEDDGW